MKGDVVELFMRGGEHIKRSTEGFAGVTQQIYSTP
jgi:hypothetical protein